MYFNYTGEKGRLQERFSRVHGPKGGCVEVFFFAIDVSS